MKEYDLFVPLCYNDGTSIEPEKFQEIQRRLLKEFDGLTYFPQPNDGFWKLGDVTYRDEIVIYRVVIAQTRSARRFLSEMKEELKRELDQEEILIIERDVKTL